MKPIRAIIFDLDHTLIQSPLCFTTIKRRLAIDPNHLILEALEQMPIQERLHKHQLLEEMELSFASESVLVENVKEVLSEFEASHLKLGILTRNCRAVVNLVMQLHALPIEASIAREEAKAKPDPEGITKLARQWNITPAEVLMVGDSQFDIECGKNARARTAHFALETANNLFEADFVFNNFRQLANWVYSISPNIP